MTARSASYLWRAGLACRYHRLPIASSGRFHLTNVVDRKQLHLNNRCRLGFEICIIELRSEHPIGRL